MTELTKSIKLSECSWIWQFWQIIVNFITAKLAWQNWKFEEILVKFVTGKSAKWMWRIWQIFAIFVTVCICGHISRNLEVNYKRNWETEARHEGNLTDWLLTGNRQKTNGILWPRLYVHKNTKGTDQLKRTWKISEKILTSIDVHWILCTQQNLNNYTLQSSLSWGELSPWVGSLSKNKQKWIKKLPNIYGIITHFYEWKSVITHSGWDERIKC